VNTHLADESAGDLREGDEMCGEAATITELPTKKPKSRLSYSKAEKCASTFETPLAHLDLSEDNISES
jgi:hypothetical protein